MSGFKRKPTQMSFLPCHVCLVEIYQNASYSLYIISGTASKCTSIITKDLQENSALLAKASWVWIILLGSPVLMDSQPISCWSPTLSLVTIIGST